VREWLHDTSAGWRFGRMSPWAGRHRLGHRLGLGFSEGSPSCPSRPIAGLWPLLSLPDDGIYFGIVVAFGVWNWTGRLLAVPVLLVTTMYAWSAAIRSASGCRRFRRRPASYRGKPGARQSAPNYKLGALFSANCADRCELPSRVWSGPRRDAPLRQQARLLDMSWLFIIWQPVVAFCIGMGLVGRGRDA
jgi:hypothetical protein